MPRKGKLMRLFFPKSRIHEKHDRRSTLSHISNCNIYKWVKFPLLNERDSHIR